MSLSNSSRTSMNRSRTLPSVSMIQVIGTPFGMPKPSSVIDFASGHRIGDGAGSLARLFQVALEVDADADDLQALRLIFFVKGVELRHFLAARRAPRRPVIDHHHLAAKLGEIERRSVERGENERRCRLTDLRRGTRRAGCGREQQSRYD